MSRLFALLVLVAVVASASAQYIYSGGLGYAGYGGYYGSPAVASYGYAGVPAYGYSGLGYTGGLAYYKK